jgi:integrase
LVDCFGKTRDLASIDEGAAEDFKMYLVAQRLASTTVHKRLQFARGFFRAALKRKLVPSNPFAEVTTKAAMKADRERFVTREETERLLAVCPNVHWRAIVALARFGGLRCPSEVLSLEWQGVDWERDRIRVASPKTEHHPGKASREVPMFPELRPILEQAFEAAPEGAVYVVGGRYREAAASPSGWRNCNLRTQFGRIIRRAGLEPWPRLFHALRASRETELAAEYPVHVVTSWLGNTPRIAMKHYLMTTEADFRRAAGRDVEAAHKAAHFDDDSAQNAAQPVPAMIRQECQETTEPQVLLGVRKLVATPGESRRESSAEREGLSQAPFRKSLSARELGRKSRFRRDFRSCGCWWLLVVVWGFLALV